MPSHGSSKAIPGLSKSPNSINPNGGQGYPVKTQLRSHSATIHVPANTQVKTVIVPLRAMTCTASAASAG